MKVALITPWENAWVPYYREAFEARVEAAAHPPSAARQAVMADLGDPTALRRAFILREVLGPPVALR